jgi:prepilin-type N-terminal cleavage/methylation domain-containing protein
MNRLRSSLGLTLIEVMITTAVIGITAAIAFAAFGDLTKRSSEQKLKSDVESLNRAVKVYLASGGSMEGVRSASDVINRLKSAADASIAFRLPGSSSSLVEPRLAIKWQSAKEAEREALRGFWDAESNQFVVTESGELGIREFYFDDDLAEIPQETGLRRSVFLYSKDSGWVWDYKDRQPVIPDARAPIKLTPSLPDPPTPASVPPPGRVELSPPIFSLPTSSRPISDFNLSLILGNPNPAGSSEILYSLDYSDWKTFDGGAISIPPASNVRAQAIASDASKWISSRVQSEAYEATAVKLAPPVIAATSTRVCSKT